MKKFLLVIACFWQISAFAGGWVSGGGDPLRIYFEEGADLALDILEQVRPEHFSKVIPANVSEFFVKNQAALMKDLERTGFDWILSGQATCALTDFQASAVIHLSLENCRTISGREDAAKLLLHELTHHLGVRDEEFADQFAIQLAIAWENLKALEVPLCRNPEQVDVIERLAGSWKMDPTLSLRLGAKQPRASVAFEFLPKKEFAREFKGLGQCALQAGRLTVHRPQQPPQHMPYLIVARQGAMYIVTPTIKQQPRSRRGPRIPFRDEQRAWYFSLTKTRNQTDDLLFVGDENGEDAHSAFQRR